jgi:cytidine deaminase
MNPLVLVVIIVIVLFILSFIAFVLFALKLSSLGNIPKDLKDSAKKYLSDNNKLVNKIMLSKNEFENFIKDNNCTKTQALLAFSDAAQYFFATHLPISNYHVGAVVRGSSGNIYFGGNMEFTNVSLTTTIHGEQSACYNAFINGEKTLTHLAVNAPPCGYCRQFLNELSNANSLIILIEDPNRPGEIISNTLPKFLPYSFGPKDLGNTTGMLDSKPFDLSLGDMTGMTGMTGTTGYSPLVLKTLDYAKRSYAPYSLRPSAVGLLFADESMYFGIYLENAAYDPSLDPIISALNYATINGKSLKDIKEVVLLEAMIVDSSKQKNVSTLNTTNGIINSINLENNLNLKVNYVQVDIKL